MVSAETNLVIMSCTDFVCILSAVPCERVFFGVHTSTWRVEKPPGSGDGRVLYRMIVLSGKKRIMSF